MRRANFVLLVLAVLAVVGIALIVALAPPTGPAATSSDEVTALTRTRRHHNEPEPPPTAPSEPLPTSATTPETVAAEPEAEPAPLGAGRLRGVVIDVVDRAPVVGCEIALLHPTGDAVAETRTDAAGEYGFERIPEDVPLVLEFAAPGYLSGLCCDVRLAAAQLLRKDVELVRPPTLGLTVSEQGSRVPAARALVRLSLDGAPVARASTDEDGRLRLALPAFGEFVLHLGGSEYAERPGEIVRLLPGGGDLELERRVQPGAALRVRVFEPSGDAAGAANVTVSADGLEPRPGITDRSGVVLFDGLAPRTSYEVVAGYDDELRPALRGQSFARVFADRESVVDVRLRPAGRVAGRVTRADGSGIAGANVTVFLPGGTRATTVRTDEDGRFDATRVPGTKVRLEVEAPGFHKRESRALVTRWSTEGETPTELRLSARPPAVVTGVVADRTGAVLRAGVRAIPSGVRTEADAKGRYRLELPAGIEEQRLVASAPGHHMLEDGPERAPAIEVLSGREQRVDLVLEPDPPDEEAAARGDGHPSDDADGAGVEIVGRVMDGRSAPVARARVSCAGVFTDTDADGRFRLANVPFLDTDARILPRLGIAPPPGLLMPSGTLLAPVAAGKRHVDTGETRLAARSLAILDLTQAIGGATPESPQRAFTFAFSHADEFVGERTAMLSPRHGVSYDGTWMHLPPAHSWEEEGHGRVWVLVPTSRGATTANAGWRLRPDAADTLRLTGADVLVAVRVTVPKPYVSGQVKFSLDATAAEAANSRDPFHTVMSTRSFRETVAGRSFDVPDVPRGRWSLELAPPAGRRLPVLRATLDTEAPDGRPRIVFKSR